MKDIADLSLNIAANPNRKPATGAAMLLTVALRLSGIPAFGSLDPQGFSLN